MELNVEQNEPKPGQELTTTVVTFDRSGRTIQEEHYQKGVLDGRTIYEYGSNGVMSKQITISPDEKRNEHDYEDTASAVSEMTRSHVYDDSWTGATAIKWNSKGNPTEQRSGKEQVIYRYDSYDREAEVRWFYSGYPEFSTQSTYEDDPYGNWIKREELLRKDGVVQRPGYKSFTIYRRTISYFDEY